MIVVEVGPTELSESVTIELSVVFVLISVGNTEESVTPGRAPMLLE